MSSRPLSRRTTLASGLTVAGLVAGAGCSVRMPGSGTTGPGALPRAGRLDPDVQIVVDLVNALQQSVALLAETRRRHPKLTSSVVPLLSVQRDHLAVLRDAAPANVLTKEHPLAVAVPALGSLAQTRV
ncbi:MAG: hypothetical protein M3Y66_07425, partial [Actinomycetota bacterium]|nr:hypothetical protein [Actinomycetota bacterium]